MFRIVALVIQGVFLIGNIRGMLVTEEKIKRLYYFIGACLIGLVLYYIWLT